MSDAKAKAITIMPSDEALWDAVKFVAIALRETPYGTRYGLDMIKVRGNKQFAVTDGRCLHMAKCDHELSAGLYDVLANTEQAVVLRRNDNPTKLFVDDKTIDGAEPESTHAFDIRWAENDIPIGAQIQFVVAANGGPCLNPQYLFAIAAMRGHSIRVSFSPGVEIIPVVIQGQSKKGAELQATIMGMNYNWPPVAADPAEKEA